MRIFYIILIIVIATILILSGYSLLNTYTSIKYEVEEPGLLKPLTQEMHDKESIYKSLILSLWVNVALCFVAIALLMNRLFSKISNK